MSNRASFVIQRGWRIRLRRKLARSQFGIRALEKLCRRRTLVHLEKIKLRLFDQVA